MRSNQQNQGRLRRCPPLEYDGRSVRDFGSYLSELTCHFLFHLWWGSQSWPRWHVGNTPHSYTLSLTHQNASEQMTERGGENKTRAWTERTELEKRDERNVWQNLFSQLLGLNGLGKKQSYCFFPAEQSITRYTTVQPIKRTDVFILKASFSVKFN